MADINVLAAKALARLEASPDKSRLKYYIETERVIIGSGVSNKNDVKRLTRLVRLRVDQIRAAEKKRRAR